ncbi:MAG: PfkB family carbohydrate kinase, partial [Treponema sp.]|nr:PfkB family carbohydrate kinase [Treponema sp.]
SYVTIPGSTRICWTLLDRTAGTTTEIVVGEPIEDISQQPEVKLLKLLVDFLPEIDAVLLAGSRPNIWSKDLYAAIAGMTKDAGKIFLADYIGDDLQLTLKSVTPDIIKINDEEFEKTFGVESGNLKTAITEKSRELQNMIVVTRGCDSTYAAKNGEFFECPAEVVKPVNTTACGDSFNAGFLHEYLNNGDFMKALQKGTWAAARNAESEIPGSINR